MMLVQRSARSALTVGFALLLGFGCQSIAGIEDVKVVGAALCDEYCDEVTEACPGDLGVYADRASCKSVCARLPAGSETAKTGNTVQCRMEQARQASVAEAPVEKAFHCPSAGPGGGDQCAPTGAKADCEGYCELYRSACTSISKDWGFGTQEECVRKCAGIPPANYAVATAAATGDTLACRLFHATAALEEPEANCGPAGLRPQGACIGNADADPDCDGLCLVGSVACAGKASVFESTKQCVETCKRTVPGNRVDTSKLDTRACRSFHAYNALLINPMVHCPHIGPGGDGVCSDAMDSNCKPYCRLAAAACPAQFGTAFGTDAKCLEACRGFTGGMGPNAYNVEAAKSGNTLQCRTLHVTRALAGDADACVGAFGGDPCDG